MREIKLWFMPKTFCCVTRSKASSFFTKKRRTSLKRTTPTNFLSPSKTIATRRCLMRVRWSQTETREMSPPFTSTRSTALCAQLWPGLSLLSLSWFLSTHLAQLESFQLPAATCFTCSSAPQPLISLVSIDSYLLNSSMWLMVNSVDLISQCCRGA